MDAYQDAYLDPPWKIMYLKNKAELSKVTLSCMDTQLLPAGEHRDPKRDFRDCPPLVKPQSRDEHPASPRACSAPGWDFRMGRKSHKNPQNWQPHQAAAPMISGKGWWIQQSWFQPGWALSPTPWELHTSPCWVKHETPRITPSMGTHTAVTHTALWGTLYTITALMFSPKTLPLLLINYRPQTRQSKLHPTHTDFQIMQVQIKNSGSTTNFSPQTIPAVFLSNNPMEVPNNITRL